MPRKYVKFIPTPYQLKLIRQGMLRKSRHELASSLNCSFDTVRSMEGGRRPITAARMAVLRKNFDVSNYDLMTFLFEAGELEQDQLAEYERLSDDAE